MRINKFISHNTRYSRREADELIKQGLVKINNKIALLSDEVKFVDKVFVKGKDVTSLIRQQQINENVSKIASYKGVRQYLVERQQAMAAVGGVILDGRDIGSVVLPKAELKIYLTASVDARAKRRWLEVQGTCNEQSLEDIK